MTVNRILQLLVLANGGNCKTAATFPSEALKQQNASCFSAIFLEKIKNSEAM